MRSPLTLGLIALALAGAPANAQQAIPPAPAVVQGPAPVAHLQTLAEAMAQDAAEYARREGVSADEARRRLIAQAETIAATDALAHEFRKRLAGISIEHRPAYRIVVLLTGSRAVADRAIVAREMTVPVVFRTGAPATRKRLVAAITRHQAELRAALPHPPALAADPRTGALLVMVPGGDADRYPPGELEAKLGKIAAVPVRIRALEPKEVNLEVEGGSRVEGINPADGRRYACTTGFVVTDGTRTGIVTAAHCPDTLSYLDPARHQIPLAFAGQWGWGFQDVQLHLSPEALAPLFYADTAKTAARAVTSWRYRDSVRAGDFVCHRGERTGYSCAEVEWTDFAPAGDLCGGACQPKWVAVSGPGCKGGDSGAPVFDGTVALGIVKGASYRADGSCNFYFYMAVDYLPEGWLPLYDRAGGLAPGEVQP